jgi:pyridinium-3,5-bisthiocarboxylic acid mononucleotide nickel chelatase
MKTLYFDVQWGASGDMILSSLIDAGVPVDYLARELSKLSIPGFSINVDKQQHSGIQCSHLQLKWDAPHAPSHSHHHGHSHDHGAFRNPRQILDLIEKASYGDRVFERCEKILMRIARAEAAVHGVPIDEVHFHEIGAIDTIVDVAGISLCIDYLGIERIFFSTLVDGRGTVTTRHGVMPVPVPAVAKLCEGYALTIRDIESELLTPTGCAVLVALGEQALFSPGGRIGTTGYGCGDKKFDAFPNMLRVFIMDDAGEAQDTRDYIWCLESDMDHISGEIMGDVAGRLLAASAVDVAWCPVFMKKGRPGYRLSVLCNEETRQKLIDLVMLHTRTLGIRMQRMERVVAQRSAATMQFHDASIQEKYCSYKGISFSKPEYESLSEVSAKTGKPILALLEEYIKSKK